MNNYKYYATYKDQNGVVFDYRLNVNDPFELESKANELAKAYEWMLLATYEKEV